MAAGNAWSSPEKPHARSTGVSQAFATVSRASKNCNRARHYWSAATLGGRAGRSSRWNRAELRKRTQWCDALPWWLASRLGEGTIPARVMFWVNDPSNRETDQAQISTVGGRFSSGDCHNSSRATLLTAGSQLHDRGESPPLRQGACAKPGHNLLGGTQPRRPLSVGATAFGRLRNSGDGHATRQRARYSAISPN